MYYKLVGLLSLIFTGFTVSVTAAEEVKLASHRAVYDMSLAKSTSGASVVGVAGTMVLEFLDVCDGYTLNQRIRTDMEDSTGSVSTSDFIISSWESKDGKKFRFKLKHDQSDQPVEEHVGQAELKKSGGVVNLTRPKKEQLKLPPGTVFPTEHLVQLIKAAKEGKTYIPVRVFDGSGGEGLFETGTYISHKRGEDKSLAAKPLSSIQSWPVRIAYFNLQEQDETPRYEVAFRMYANGISGDLILDYGEFAMKGRLMKLELLPKNGC